MSKSNPFHLAVPAGDLKSAADFTKIFLDANLVIEKKVNG